MRGEGKVYFVENYWRAAFLRVLLCFMYWIMNFSAQCVNIFLWRDISSCGSWCGGVPVLIFKYKYDAFGSVRL